MELTNTKQTSEILDELSEYLQYQIPEVLSETTGYAKFIAFYIDKGGTGKSTHVFNFAGYCADVLNKRVLIIDGDRSKNISYTFRVEGECTVSNMFKTFKSDKPFSVYHTSNKNIDIIPGSSTFTDEGVNINDSKGKYMEFLDFVFYNQDFFNQNYDFVIIDTHNDKSIVTYNLLAACNLVVNVVAPDGNSFTAFEDFPNKVETILKPMTIPPMSRESATDLDIVVLANNIVMNGVNMTQETKILIKDLEAEDNYIGLIPYRKNVGISCLTGENIFQMYENLPPKQKKSVGLINYLTNVSEIYNKIITSACKKAKESQE